MTDQDASKSTTGNLITPQWTQSNAKPLLCVQDLSVEFRTGRRINRAVDHVSFNIHKGETVALVGESGSGKSVTALSILQLLPYPTASHPSGSIRFEGQELVGATKRELSKIRGDRIGMIFQEPLSSLNPLHRVSHQIGEVLKTHKGMDDHSIEKRVLELLSLVGIKKPQQKLNAWPHQLSGGQRQRVMIAMALANEPDLLIADEPTTALDVTVQAQILALLESLQSELNMAMLWITHDLGVVEKITDRVCVMRQGKIIESRPTVELFKNPHDQYTKELLSAEPKPKPIRIQTIESTLVQAVNLRVWFPIKRGVLRRTVDYVKAVNDVSFTLKRGQTVGVVGESGCGKTSLALALLRLIPSTGRILFDGVDLQSGKRDQIQNFRESAQMVFQDPFASLSPRMTIDNIIAEGLDAHNLCRTEEERDHRVSTALQQMELSPDIRHRYPHEFSGGQRQRIAIARAAIMQPKLIVLDEPTSAVDRSVQSHLIDLLLKLQQDHNISYLFISHDLKVVRALSDDIIIMRQGHAVEQGSAPEIFNNPQNPYTRILLNAALELHVAEEDTRLIS